MPKCQLSLSDASFCHMRVLSIFTYLAICTSCGSNASYLVTEFGFKTGNEYLHNTGDISVVTLWFNSTIYQASTTALHIDTWFTFHMLQEPYFRVIATNCSNITHAKIMIQLDSDDAVCVDQVKLVTQSGVLYGIDAHSDNDTVICIDNEPVSQPYGNGPYKQILYFDTTRPNVYINDSLWRDGTNVIPQSNTFQCARTWRRDPLRLTAKYGTSGGDFHSVLDQGRVYAMLNWGLESSKYLQIRGWESDWQMADTIYGTGTERSLCTPFSLSSDDYITGYHIWFDSKGISGLQFVTRNGVTLSCIGISDSTTTSYSNNYDYGPFNFSYLTGWNVWSGEYIDQIQFQFTESLLTASPTQVTAVPSQMLTEGSSSDPTDIHTSNTNTPTRTLSSNPTSLMVTVIVIACILVLWICLIIDHIKKQNMRVREVAGVEDDEDECDDQEPGSGPKEIERVQNENQIGVEGELEHNESDPPDFTVEGNYNIPPRIVYNMHYADDVVVIGDGDMPTSLTST
eukprot:308500_1